MSTVIRDQPFTADDYRRMEDDGKRYEVIHGVLIMAPAPNRFHQDVSRNLCRIIYSFLHTHPIGGSYDAPFDVYLDENNVVQPDFVFVSKSSKAKLVAEGVHGSPDLVVEILSPSTSRRDLREKRELYAKFGSVEYWVVSPETRQLQIYQLQSDATRPALVLEESDKTESALLPGLSFGVNELFVTPD
jgi:Uma2 family endonuclease